MGNGGGFIVSLCLGGHPLITESPKTKRRYFAALEYLISSCTPKAEGYAEAMLSQYREAFLPDEGGALEEGGRAVKKTVSDFLRPRKREYGSMLLCDVAFILLNREAVEKACEMISKHVTRRKQAILEESVSLLYNYREIPPELARTARLIKQFRANQNFASRREMRVMITANMSAGKSTLINALVGKPVARMAQAACTANLGFIYNKPFEDNRIHLSASPLNLNAERGDLKKVDKNSSYSASSYFRAYNAYNNMEWGAQVRVCLIDTPGDNYFVNREHGKLTQKAINEENYDKVICILNAESSLGTTDAKKHLEYIYKNVPSEKVIFVLNKLDVFKPTDGDSIPESINRLRADLEKIGFKNPIICPISVHFSLLLKRKKFGDDLSEQEARCLNRYIEDFKEYGYDLSEYYGAVNSREADNGDLLAQWGGRCGIHGLENVIYEGVCK